MSDDVVKSYNIWYSSQIAKKPTEIYILAIREKKNDLIKWLRLEMKLSWDESICFELSRLAQFDMLRWVVENGCPYNSHNSKRKNLYICKDISLHGDIETMKWAKTQLDVEWNNVVSSNIASKGDPTFLNWVLSNGCPRDNLEMCCSAARSNNVAVFKWLVEEHKCLIQEQVGLAIVESKNKDLLEWAITKNLQYGNDLYYKIVRNGRLDMLELLPDRIQYLNTVKNKKSILEFSKKIGRLAAKYGHLHILKWLYEKYFPEKCFPVNTICLGAAQGGHLEVLKWARSHGCTWNKEVTLVAYQNEHHDLYKWAVDNGCPDYK